MSDKPVVNFPLTINMSDLLAYNETMDELARLRVRLAVVPVEAIRRQYRIGFHLYEKHEEDIEAILAWLRNLEPQP